MISYEKSQVEASSAAATATDEVSIELEPFIHQVGGRSAILALGECICKPINEREFLFYESLDKCAPHLKPFVPNYNGIIAVNFEESNDGYLTITTKPSKMLFDQSKSSTPTVATAGEAYHHHHSMIRHSPNSPYQKFVTKYRVRLCRAQKEVFIESHEQDIEKDVADDLETSKKRLENLLLSGDTAASSSSLTKEESKQSNHLLLRTNSTTATNIANISPTNLLRSRSTSISIPNFEDAEKRAALVVKQPQPPPPLLAKEQVRCPRMVSGSPQSTPDNASPHKAAPAIYSLSTTKHNPWVLKTISSLIEFNESMKKEQKFILLENLVAKFQYPCIMDLKMGTRLHDDNASQMKKESHESKVNETTSGALGLRITGIQLYDKDLDRFICYNKYYGRKLTPEGFRTSLKTFVSADNFKKYGLLDKLIAKLQQLRSVVIKLNTFRFYTSSLLLIYEGNTCDCLVGGGSGEEATTTKHQNNHPEDVMAGDCEALHDVEKMLDVRLIDFAHSTHSQINAANSNQVREEETTTTTNNATTQSSETPTSEGYDEGFVFGLDNLIKILTLFKADHSIN